LPPAPKGRENAYELANKILDPSTSNGGIINSYRNNYRDFDAYMKYLEKNEKELIVGNLTQRAQSILTRTDLNDKEKQALIDDLVFIINRISPEKALSITTGSGQGTKMDLQTFNQNLKDPEFTNQVLVSTYQKNFRGLEKEILKLTDNSLIKNELIPNINKRISQEKDKTIKNNLVYYRDRISDKANL
jgi:lipopolysaccharide export LptBFGC system permease protein LptF